MPETVIRTSPLRGTCYVCGDEIQPYEPYRRETIEPPPARGHRYRLYHLTCPVGDPPHPQPEPAPF